MNLHSLFWLKYYSSETSGLPGTIVGLLFSEFLV